MGIWQRMKRLVRANTNATLSKLEDPRKELGLLEEDLREEKKRAKQAVLEALSEHKKLEKQLQEEQRLSTYWESKAMRAIELGDDDLAREALKAKGKYDEQVEELGGALEEHGAAIEALKQAERAMEKRSRELLQQRDVLLARLDHAEIHKQTHAGMELGSDSPIAEFERMRREVEQKEAEVELGGSLHRPLQEADLERRLRELEDRTGEGSGEADDALAKLKARMRKS